MAGMCRGPRKGNNDGCPWPAVESADTELCARHLLIAANDVKQIGVQLLVSIVKEEEQGK